jgi:type II secretory pathway component GspD/PulD (secretin)
VAAKKMKKGLAMTRLKSGALVTKCSAAAMSAFLFVTPAAWAQINTPDNTASGSESTGKGVLTFTTPDGQSTSANAASLPPVESATNAATQPAAPLKGDGLEGKTAEVTGQEAAIDDGTQLAQGAGGISSKKLDPAYNRLPYKPGEIKVRRAFKLFAKEELIHNLSFRETPIKEVIGELARRGSLNVLLDKSVFGKVTGDLHDVTLNEAMDAVLAAAGLQSRVLDSNACIIASPNSLGMLGLNRTHSKVFKLNYLSPYDCANDLNCSVFFRGYIPDFSGTFKNNSQQKSTENPKFVSEKSEDSKLQGVGEGGAALSKTGKEVSGNAKEDLETSDSNTEYSFASRLDTMRQLRGSTRINTQEGQGFNSAAQDPGTLQIRAFQEVSTDYQVDNNGGGAIVIPDARNRQVIVVGTPDDLAVAEECIHLLDRRPKQVHVQVSLVELNNTGLRELGASLNLQGAGASGALLGGSGAPMINALPGMGSTGGYNQASTVFNSSSMTPSNVYTFYPNNPNIFPKISPSGPVPLVGSFVSSITQVAPKIAGVATPDTFYKGVLGGFFPTFIAPTIAGVSAASSSTSNFNFLTLGSAAGGKANIATMPMGANISLNLLLQQNKAKILANPSVVVSDNTEALVTLASEVIHKVTSTVSLGVTNVNVELTKAGIFLDVLPKCTDDGFIYMRLRPQVSAPLGAPQTFANQQVIVTLLNIREIMAQEIRVKDGQTLVLGGLFTEQEASQISKVPYLAETPLFGALFRNTLKGRQRTELMLMITPKIVEEQPTVPGMTDPRPQANL